jgi:hypothetical protein
MKRKLFTIFVIVVVLLIGAQFIPVNRSNPPVTGQIQVPPDVSRILRTSCYDCHSNETVWPWYSYVAPVSWMVAHDVHEGRSKMNFSTWQEMSKKDQAEKVRKIWEHVSEGKMPPERYLIKHRNARLTEEDRRILHEWTQSWNAGTKAGEEAGEGD